MAIIFDGYQVAAGKEAHLRQKVQQLRALGKSPHVVAFLFVEDRASQIYTDLKQQAAARLGIIYEVQRFSFTDSIAVIQQAIQAQSDNPAVTGIIIQKPWTQKWLAVQAAANPGKTFSSTDFQNWWQQLVTQIATTKSHGINKDVDGLHPDTLTAIEAGSWRIQNMVLPATVRAVLSTLKFYQEHYEPTFDYTQQNVLIIGQSDLLGRPLYYQIRNEMLGQFICPLQDNSNLSAQSSVPNPLAKAWPRAPRENQSASAELRLEKNKKCEVKLIGKNGFNKIIEQKKSLADFSLIIAATGQRFLITPPLVGEQTILIDVGEPQPDIDPACVSKAKFFTPVPGGIGPMTVVSLMANAIDLLKNPSV